MAQELLFQGGINPRNRELRRQLRAIDGLAPSLETESTTFDANVEAAVRRFQQAAVALGLKDAQGNPIMIDGVCGPQVLGLIERYNENNAVRVGMNALLNPSTSVPAQTAAAPVAAVEPTAHSAPVPAPTAPRMPAAAPSSSAVTSENEQALLLGTYAVPPSTNRQSSGRYRLVTVADEREKQENTRATYTEMVLLDDKGVEVWRGMMNSGSQYLEPLPGLVAESENAITTEYEIDWNDVRRNRGVHGDRVGRDGMRMSDGSLGYSFTLENPDNMSEIGGAGRNSMRIHPGGFNVDTAGCLEFVDSRGQISGESDEKARSFLDIMTSLPEDKRPLSLEVANHRQLRPPVAKAPEEERRRGFEVADAGANGDLDGVVNVVRHIGSGLNNIGRSLGNALGFFHRA